MANTIIAKNKKNGRTIIGTRKTKPKIQVKRKKKIEAKPTDPRRMA